MVIKLVYKHSSGLRFALEGECERNENPLKTMELIDVRLVDGRGRYLGADLSPVLLNAEDAVDGMLKALAQEAAEAEASRE